MNILLMDGLPETYEGIPLSADFRNMIQVDLILREQNTSEAEKIIAALSQLYPQIPSDMNKAIAGLQWFYARGATEAGGKEGTAKKPAKRSFSFEQDANLIYAAFYATYGISLTTVEFLHWWEFMALFEGLPEDTLIRRVMYWRTAEPAELSKEERKHILKMRSLFPLEDSTQKDMDITALNQQTKDRVARRFEEARKAKTAPP